MSFLARFKEASPSSPYISRTPGGNLVLRCFDVAFRRLIDILRGSFVKKSDLKCRQIDCKKVDLTDRKVKYGKGL